MADDASFADEIATIVLAGGRPQIPAAAAPAGYRSLLERCWATDPATRPRFAEICTELLAQYTTMANPYEGDLVGLATTESNLSRQ